MSRKQAKTTQAEPTTPRPIDGAGRELDAFGLPFSGPARARALAELGKPDPNFEPEAWSSAGAGVVTTAPVAPVTETEKNDG